MNADQHGVAWADFDNDGDQDFVVIVGGNGGGTTSPKNANQLYRNDKTNFVEVAYEKGISLSNARGRSPLWLDFNHDGLLDLAVANLVSIGTPTSTIFRQENGHFIDIGGDVDFQFTENTNVFQIADLYLNKQLEIVGLSQIYGILAQEFTEIPFVNVTQLFIENPLQARGNGVVIADFDNDFREDIFVPLGSQPLELNQVSVNEIHFAMVVSDEAKELGIFFNTSGTTYFELAAPWFSLSDVFIGEEGKHPLNLSFTLNPTDTTNQGLFQYESNIDRGIFIGYDQSSSMWKVVLNTDYVNPGG